jgi:flagellar hook-associated protein 3 FlgL
MSMTSIGDLSRQFMTLRHNAQTRQDLDKLTRELSTGNVADLTAHLGGDGIRLGEIDRQLGLDEAYLRVARGTGQMLSSMQLALEKVDTARSGLGSKLLGITRDTVPSQQAAASAAGAAAFSDMVVALNTTFGGATLFGGVTFDRPALAPAATMLTSLRAAATGAVTAADVTAVVDTWFDAPGGPFETIGYLGDSGTPMRRGIGANTAIEVSARADAPAIRDQLKAAAMAALANDPAIALSNDARADLLRDAGIRTAAAAADFTNLRADLGLAEERIETNIARLSARSTAFTIMRNEMTSADPFTTASRLQAVQAQLETQYTLTARLAGLSLVGYLR